MNSRKEPKKAKQARMISRQRDRIKYLEMLVEVLLRPEEEKVFKEPTPPTGLIYEFDYKKKDTAHPR